MKEIQKKRLFLALMFVGVFLILTQVGYSDGDDAFFYQYTHEMGFLEYLTWRYQTWVGRMSGEAMVYIAFRAGAWFWRAVNACMIVLLPIGVLKLACKAAGVSEETLGADVYVLSAAGYLLMSVLTAGYAAIWMNGSIFYTWSFTCGIWSLIPVADFVFDTGKCSWKQFLYSIPCAVIGSMSIEQMGAVLLAFEVLAILFTCRRGGTWKFHPGLFLQTAATFAAFFLLFAAPGNALRVAAETVNWMPQYDALSVGEHLFLTVQWLLSSFANENRLFLCGIWLGGLLHLRGRNKKSDTVWMAAAGIFLVSALLPFFGVKALSDVGMNLTDITVCLTEVPQASALTVQNVIALCWQAAALLFTFFYLAKITENSPVMLFAYLGGIASEAIMYFSPTIYASGARVYYLTDWMYLFLILVLFLKLHDKKQKNVYAAVLLALGICNFVSQIPLISEFM